MADCCYILKKEINGITHELPLTCDEISLIWLHYDNFMIEEQVINKLIDDYGIKDISEFESIIDELVYRYNKNREYGCDEEHSVQFAFEEMNVEIDNLLALLTRSSKWIVKNL